MPYNRCLHVLLAILILSCLPGDLTAGPDEDLLYLDDLIEEAVRANPEILRDAGLVHSSQSVPSQAGSLPDPVLMLGIKNVGFDEITRGDEMMSTASVSIGQAIPFPGKLGMKEKIAGKNAERMEEKYNATVLSVIARLKVAYFDYYFVEKSIDIIRKDKELLETFEKTAQARYEVGEGIQQDVLKAQVEISRLMERLTIKEQEREETTARINRLINRPPSSPLPAPSGLEKSMLEHGLDELNRIALENSPLLKAESHAIERDKAALSLARREDLPDLAVSTGYADRGDLDGIWEVRLGISVPFYFWKKQRYGVREASYDLEASNENHQAVREFVLYRLKELYDMAQTSEELVVLYERGIIPQATLSLESAIAGYGVGNVDFLTLLDNLITLLEDELKYQRELTHHEKSIAKLEEVAGAPVTGS